MRGEMLVNATEIINVFSDAIKNEKRFIAFKKEKDGIKEIVIISTTVKSRKVERLNEIIKDYGNNMTNRTTGEKITAIFSSNDLKDLILKLGGI